jgi:hypothetical protein
MILMKRVPVPDWAFPHARHITEIEGDLGQVARERISPLLPKIYDELDRRVNEFANNPDQCFIEPDTFPVQEQLDGTYYIGAETFEGNSGEDFFTVSIRVRCAAKPGPSRGVRQEKFDYLGLDALVTTDQDGTHFEFDVGFGTSSI